MVVSCPRLKSGLALWREVSFYLRFAQNVPSIVDQAGFGLGRIAMIRADEGSPHVALTHVAVSLFSLSATPAIGQSLTSLSPKI